MIHENASHPRLRTGRLLLLGLSVILYLASLSQEAYRLDGDDHPNPWACLALLLFGWLGVFQGVLAWLANPAILTPWILLGTRRGKKRAVHFAAIALLFAMSFMLHRTILRDEGGNYARITGYAAGYWLWIASIAIAMVGGIVARVESVAPAV